MKVKIIKALVLGILICGCGRKVTTAYNMPGTYVGTYTAPAGTMPATSRAVYGTTRMPMGHGPISRMGSSYYPAQGYYRGY